ncbi:MULTISPECIES: TA system antitoxin ParD family protein [unclassified Undibacterium]|uniref:TA system antitoxin ParD family protein n=1 Tax=unclassified Undibacterium TaxID=2630295 RepID=UPI003C2DA9E1
MIIENLSDHLHDQLRQASTVLPHLIHAQTTFWIKAGILCETDMKHSFSEMDT